MTGVSPLLRQEDGEGEEGGPRGSRDLRPRVGYETDRAPNIFRDLYAHVGEPEVIMPQVLARMAEGETASDICRSMGVPRGSVAWWATFPEWRESWQRAVQALGSVQGEWVTEEAKKAIDAKDYVRVQGIQVYVKALQWAAGRHHAKQYGDKIDVTSQGARVGVIALPEEQPVREGHGEVVEEAVVIPAHVGEGTNTSTRAALVPGMMRDTPIGDHPYRNKAMLGIAGLANPDSQKFKTALSTVVMVDGLPEITEGEYRHQWPFLPVTANISFQGGSAAALRQQRRRCRERQEKALKVLIQRGLWPPTSSEHPQHAYIAQFYDRLYDPLGERRRMGDGTRHPMERQKPGPRPRRK